mgnify:CR=1 FL=1
MLRNVASIINFRIVLRPRFSVTLCPHAPKMFTVAKQQHKVATLQIAQRMRLPWLSQSPSDDALAARTDCVVPENVLAENVPPLAVVDVINLDQANVVVNRGRPRNQG